MKQIFRPALRIILVYVVLSTLWIYFSDWLLRVYGSTYNIPETVATYKGWFFIVISALLIYSLLKSEIKRREADYLTHLQEKEHLLEQLRQKNDELLEAYDKTIFGWSRVLELRSREIRDHSRRVTDLSVGLAKCLGLEEPDLSHIRRGAMLHDIGKMAIPDRIMLKKKKLNDEEWAFMRRHPILGFEMLSEIEYLRPAIDILLCHHEKWNGEGYPFGLSREQIPLYARIFTVADVWDAMVSERVYHNGHSIEHAAEYLRSEAGKHFDPVIVDIFLRMIDEDELLDQVYDDVEKVEA
jgi:putative nucleotidyltransferase with HDIG domain